MADRVAAREALDSNGSSPPAAKRKIDSSADSVHGRLANLADFSVRKVLSNNTRSKLICLLGGFAGAAGDALVVLEKTAFVEEDLLSKSEYFAETNSLNKIFHNDVYGNYEYLLSANLNYLKTTIIHPATEREIQKYSTWTPHIIDETQQLYEEIVLPIIKEKCSTNLQWLYNILDHVSEADRIVFEDPDPKIGFILLPDLKWDGKTIDTLYLVALVNARDIKSIRDLTVEHLPLLRNILKKGSEAIENKYNVPKSQLRIYLHYQPSYYHLHVHFSYLRHEAPGIVTERAHMLANVIGNIELLPDYYRKATLPYVVRETDDLFKAFEEKGVLKKSPGVTRNDDSGGI